MDYISERLAAFAARFRLAVRLVAGAWSPVTVKGTFTVETRDARTGERIEAECGTTENIVVDVGLAELAKMLTKYTPGTGYRIAVGTSNTAPAAAQTGLIAQVFEADVTSVSSASAVFTAKLFLDTGDANGSTLVEAGLKHNNVLIDRALITSVAKDATKTVTVQVSLTISR